MRVALVGLTVLYSVCIAFADDDPVTCTSVVKLNNANDNVRLHSHDVKYGSGSGQQSITAIKGSDDVNSHWQILGALDKPCKRGEHIKCGSTIRLLHLTTRCYLHSHLFPAPLSKNNQEVSCFGKDTESDTGDHWTVVCGGDIWTEDDEVKLKHQDTGKYLATSGQQYGRPIAGQREVVAASSPSYQANWKVAEGVYVQRKSDDGF